MPWTFSFLVTLLVVHFCNELHGLCVPVITIVRASMVMTTTTTATGQLAVVVFRLWIGAFFAWMVVKKLVDG